MHPQRTLAVSGSQEVAPSAEFRRESEHHNLRSDNFKIGSALANLATHQYDALGRRYLCGHCGNHRAHPRLAELPGRSNESYRARRFPSRAAILPVGAHDSVGGVKEVALDEVGTAC